jgi:hypothetical protein
LPRRRNRSNEGDSVSDIVPRLYDATFTEVNTEQFVKKLLGDSEIERILLRLDRLTLDEARMMEAQILEVVCGLMNNMKVVMNGEWSALVDSETQGQTVVLIGGETSTSAIRQTLGRLKLCG